MPIRIPTLLCVIMLGTWMHKEDGEVEELGTHTSDGFYNPSQGTKNKGNHMMKGMRSHDSTCMQEHHTETN